MAKPCPCEAERRYRREAHKNPQDGIYKATILRHYRSPAWRSPTLDHLAWASEASRTCGDRVALGYAVAEGELATVRFAGEGCSISIASADMAAEVLEGLSLADARHVVDEALAFLDRLEKGEAVESPLPGYEDFESLESLAQYPTRVACARLAWTAAKEALLKAG